MKQIFEPINSKNLKLKNRLVRSATWEGIAEPNGDISQNAYQIYDELAKGGVGLIINGFTSVSADDVYFDGMMRLSNDDLIPKYKKLTEIIHAQNCAVMAQLALGGFYKNSNLIEPNQMSKNDIKEVVNLFANAAKRAQIAGFDGVQIHAAHFFFLSRFISPFANHRNDNYGGSTGNRTRILIEILTQIYKIAPNLHISIKINSNDFIYGGIDEAESLKICKILSNFGIDSIEVSGNGTSVTKIKPHINEAYFLNFAEKLAEQVKTPIILVGGLRSKKIMQEILNSTKIELLSLSRPLLREPDLPNKFKNDKCEFAKCILCNGCYSSFEHRCIFRKNDEKA